MVGQWQDGLVLTPEMATHPNISWNRDLKTMIMRMPSLKWDEYVRTRVLPCLVTQVCELKILGRS